MPLIELVSTSMPSSQPNPSNTKENVTSALPIQCQKQEKKQLQNTAAILKQASLIHKNPKLTLKISKFLYYSKQETFQWIHTNQAKRLKKPKTPNPKFYNDRSNETQCESTKNIKIPIRDS